MTIARTAVSATLGVIVALGAGMLLALTSPHPVALASALYVGVFLGGLVAGVVARQAIIGLVVGAYFFRPGMTRPADAVLINLVADPEVTRAIAAIFAIVIAVVGCLVGIAAVRRVGQYRAV